ncbi:MAG: hypothetical protein A3J14_02010 [Candidatus Levybacteria bacterium RIFCSPLOWO2_02_FULL_37_18]|nr:MAG: hypothetical protein A3J14_02010 [Candidatus Levybacteria bacterium RIFCSPLOWO2_02_FULL_37_18]
MKERIKRVAQNPLILGSAVIFFGTLFANFLNFLFNFYMTRNMTVSDYGILSSLVSVIMLSALTSDSFAPTIVHFSGGFFARKETEKVIGLFHELNRYFLALGILILALFLVFGKYIGIFFKIEDQFLVILVGIIVFINLLGTVNRGILQAKLSFRYISFIYICSSFVKLVIGISLVILGFRVKGPLWAFIISFSVAYFLTFFPLKFLLKREGKTSGVRIGEIVSYAAPATLSLVGLTSFISTDILLVKHFFSSDDAGIYAGISLLGRIIYFFTAPITMVLFPLIVQRNTRGEKYIHLLKLGGLLVFLCSFAITISYYLFPDFFIKIILKREEYLIGIPFLGLFGIFMIIYSLLFLITNFYLSIKKTKVFLVILFFAFLQGILIWFYHETFQNIVLISIFSCLIPLSLFILHLAFYGKNK